MEEKAFWQKQKWLQIVDRKTKYGDIIETRVKMLPHFTCFLRTQSHVLQNQNNSIINLVSMFIFYKIHKQFSVRVPPLHTEGVKTALIVHKH
jgi:hypothetical protein